LKSFAQISQIGKRSFSQSRTASVTNCVKTDLWYINCPNGRLAENVFKLTSTNSNPKAGNWENEMTSFFGQVSKYRH